MKEIKVNPLSYKSVVRAYYALVQYKEALREFPKPFVRALTDRLNEILGTQAPPAAQGMWHFYISVGENFCQGIFEFDGEVEFIEFGTGIVGLNQHGGINDEWLKKLPPPYNQGYNTGPSIVHFEDPNQDFWVYYDETGRHWTQGVPADPFIYRSVKQLMNEHAKIAREVFAKENIGNMYVPFE